MKLNIYSIKKILFQDEAKSVNLKSVSGELTLLPHHIPLITELANGPIKIIDKNDKTHIINASAGFLEVKPFEINILCQE